MRRLAAHNTEESARKHFLISSVVMTSVGTICDAWSYTTRELVEATLKPGSMSSAAPIPTQPHCTSVTLLSFSFIPPFSKKYYPLPNY